VLKANQRTDFLKSDAAVEETGIYAVLKCGKYKAYKVYESSCPDSRMKGIFN